MNNNKVTWDSWKNNLKAVGDYLNANYIIRSDVKISIKSDETSIILSAPISGKAINGGWTDTEYKRFATFDELAKKLFNDDIEINYNNCFPNDEDCPDIYAFLFEIGEDEELGHLDSNDTSKSLVIHKEGLDFVIEPGLLKILK